MRLLPFAVAAALLSACAPAPGEDPLPIPGETTSSKPAIDQQLVGLCINAGKPDQRPPPETICELSPPWMRTIVYAGKHRETIDVLRKYREHDAKVLVLLNQESFDIAYPKSPFFKPGADGALGSCDFASPTGDVAAFEKELETFGDELGKAAASFLLVYGEQIDAVEIMNEPDGIAGGCLRAKDYATVLTRALPKIHDGAGLFWKPLVIGAVVAQDWRGYMTEVVDALAAAKIDYDSFALHPYAHYVEDDKGACPQKWKDQSFGSLWYDVASDNSVYTIINRHPKKDGTKRKVWITEFGFPLGEDSPGCTQADYLTRSFRLLDAMRDPETKERIVEHAFWFAWNDLAHYAPHEEKLGVVDEKGALRPSGTALANLVRSYPSCPFSCRSPSKCMYDPPPNEIDTARCFQQVADPKCGRETRMLMECVAATHECRPDGYTNREHAEWACAKERDALKACAGT